MLGFKIFGMSQRIARVNELIKRELSQIIVREIEPPEGSLITITRVETSRDLAEAKVWISIFPITKANELLKILLRRAGYLQKFLNKKLIMKSVPGIKFLLDRSEVRASQVESILNKIEEGGGG